MIETNESNGSPDQSNNPPYRIRLPKFISGDEVGLGDAIKRATSYFGIQPCGGCDRLSAALNRWLTFTPRRPR